MTSIAQDLRTAAITGRKLSGVNRDVANSFLYVYWCSEGYQYRTFLLIVAEALDYREPMRGSEMFATFGGRNWTFIDDIIRTTERFHGIGAAR